MKRAYLAISSALATSALAAWPGPGRAQVVQSAIPTKLSEDITVTATRRSEKVNKVPYSITALSGAALAKAGVVNLAGLRYSVVGLQAADYGDRAANINNGFIIRGVNTEDTGVGESEFPNLAGNTVSNYLDDIPLFVNLKLTDIQRVEVLRGPQGTLFGADSEGGTVRTIHNKPSAAGFDYQIDGTVSGTDHADQPNTAADIMLNVPITERFAVRLNAGYDRNAGFINGDNAVVFDRPGNLPINAQPVLQNPADPVNSPTKTTTDHAINSGRTWFVRGDALWTVTDDISAQFAYQHQYDQSNGFNFEYPGADYVIKRLIPINPSTTKTDLGALTLTSDFGFGTITSSSSYYNVGADDLYDNSGIDVEVPYYYGGFPRLTAPNYDRLTDKAFAQEVRLVSTPGTYFDYVVGAFYQNRFTAADSVDTTPGFANWANLPGSGPAGYTNWGQYLTDYYGGTRPGSLNPPDLTYDFKRSVQFTDLAAYGDVTIHLKPHWRLIGGVRVFTEDFKQTTLQHYYNAGTTFGTDAYGTSIGTAAKRSQDQIFKASSAYDLGPNTLAYVLFSQGYRAGGANAYPIGTCAICNSAALVPYRPDHANNYEAGIKGHIGSLRYAADVFWIDWTQVQVEVDSAAYTPIIVNGGGARSRGIELEAHDNLTDELTASASYAYTNAVLTQNFALTGGFNGAAGALLPGVSRHQANAGLDYDPALLNEHKVDFHIDGAWRSGFANQIETDLSNYRHLSGFALFNAAVQAELAPRITVQLFAHNLFNAKGVTSESQLAPAGNPATYAQAHAFEPAEFVSQPLTIGLQLVIRH